MLVFALLVALPPPALKTTPGVCVQTLTSTSAELAELRRATCRAISGRARCDVQVVERLQTQERLRLLWLLPRGKARRRPRVVRLRSGRLTPAPCGEQPPGWVLRAPQQTWSDAVLWSTYARFEEEDAVDPEAGVAALRLRFPPLDTLLARDGRVRPPTELISSYEVAVGRWWRFRTDYRQAFLQLPEPFRARVWALIHDRESLSPPPWDGGVVPDAEPTDTQRVVARDAGRPQVRRARRRIRIFRPRRFDAGVSD